MTTPSTTPSTKLPPAADASGKTAGPPAPGARKGRHRRAAGPGTTMLADGEPLVWLTGGALVVALAMIIGLLGLVFWMGVTTFIPGELVLVQLRDGTTEFGEVTRTESFPLTEELISREPEPTRNAIVADLLESSGGRTAWQALPAEITARCSVLEREKAEIDQRLADARRRIETTAQARGAAPDDPEARANWIRDDQQAPDLERARQDVERLASRSAGLAQQAKAFRTAATELSKQADAKSPLDALSAASAPTRTAAVDALLARRARELGTADVQTRRRLLRTGNYDVTQTHFHWIADYQIKPNGESLPPWAIIAERTEAGHFYGFPEALVARNPRKPDPKEHDAAELAEFLELNASKLTDPKQQKIAEQALAAVRKERDAQRADGVTRFVAQFKDRPRQNLFAVTESGDTVPLDKLTPAQIVTEVQQVDGGAAEAWARYTALHPEAVERRQQRHALEKDDLGRLFQREEQARLAVRKAEIRWSDDLSGDAPAPEQQNAETAKLLPVSDLVKQISDRLHELDELRHTADTAKSIAAKARAEYGEKSPKAVAAEAIADAVKNQVEQQSRKPVQEVVSLQLQIATTPPYVQEAVKNYFAVRSSLTEETAAIRQRVDTLQAQNDLYQLRLKTAQGVERTLPLEAIVLAYPANQLSGWQRSRIYLSRWWEFLTDDPREGNSEGGVFPAIFGTVIMTLLMSLAVAPFGVLAALYLREYAKTGPIVSIIRIAINNLAGVPSVVFGVFGLGFFCYVVGAYVDGGPERAHFQTLPRGPWVMLTAFTAVLAFSAFATGLLSFASRRGEMSRTKRLGRRLAAVLWIASTVLFFYLLATTPYFRGFFRVYDQTPTFGTGGVLWASLTLALLTLPVVIVATEEALAAVPNSMREGSYGCGASRWQTIRRIVLPQALPGMMTGMILAMARGAGEVAPLMLVGVVHSAPALPVDSTIPFIHADRSFMHLGYHIYFLGFQSQNSQAAMPMVFTTTLLLISIVAALNIIAVWLRSRLRRRLHQGQF